MHTLYTTSIHYVNQIPKDAKHVYMVTFVKPDRDIDWMPELAPSAELFTKCKTDWKHLPKSHTWNDYFDDYLDTLHTNEIKINQLKDIEEILKTDDVYLLCYCNAGVYCHRKILRYYFSSLDINCVELSPTYIDIGWR